MCLTYQQHSNRESEQNTGRNLIPFCPQRDAVSMDMTPLPFFSLMSKTTDSTQKSNFFFSPARRLKPSQDQSLFLKYCFAFQQDSSIYVQLSLRNHVNRITASVSHNFTVLVAASSKQSQLQNPSWINRLKQEEGGGGGNN